jgi:hypothetical protein
MIEVSFTLEDEDIKKILFENDGTPNEKLVKSLAERLVFEGILDYIKEPELLKIQELIDGHAKEFVKQEIRKSIDRAAQDVANKYSKDFLAHQIENFVQEFISKNIIYAAKDTINKQLDLAIKTLF